MTGPRKTLADYMRESETDPFLLAGPPAPQPGWVYRDFRKMPQALWIELLKLIGPMHMDVVAQAPEQTPPAAFCRAQLWISPAAQAAWKAYLAASPASG